MTKPKNMCEYCWYVWKDIIEAAIPNFGVFVGQYEESDLEWLHCHHEQRRECEGDKI